MPPTKRSTRKPVAPKKASTTTKRRGPATMTAAHKNALAEGREQSRHVRAYLEALEAHKPKRGRQRTPATIRKQLAEVEAGLPGATGLKKLELAQRKIALANELAAKSVVVDLTELRKNFVEHAKAYSERKGYSYAAWREAGVPAEDLKAAGITRSGK